MQNLSAIQIVGKIYYRADKDVEPDKELLVWYGDNYAQELGLISDSAHSFRITAIGM